MTPPHDLDDDDDYVPAWPSGVVPDNEVSVAGDIFGPPVNVNGVHCDTMYGAPPNEPHPVFDQLDALPPAALKAVAEKLAANLPDRGRLEALLAELRGAPDNDVYAEGVVVGSYDAPVLHAAYAHLRAEGDEGGCQEVRDMVANQEP